MTFLSVTHIMVTVATVTGDNMTFLSVTHIMVTVATVTGGQYDLSLCYPYNGNSGDSNRGTI